MMSQEPISERSSILSLSNILPNTVNQFDKLWIIKLSPPKMVGHVFGSMEKKITNR